MVSDFNTLASIMQNQYLLDTEKLFVEKKRIWIFDLKEQFQHICLGIAKLQNKSTLPAISNIEYTMLYTNFINRRYVAEVWVYGDDWYCDKNQRMVGEYDVSFLFVYFDGLWDKLLSARKRYVGKVTAQEVTAFMMQALPDFYSYLINIVRFAIVDCVDKKPFIDVAKNETFRVNVGDYMAKTEPVFTISKNKDAGNLADWFSEQLENEYSFEDYSEVDFSGHSFPATDFRYASFRMSILNNVSFKASKLIGANFRNARMENCYLDNCAIQEADFSYAVMKNTSLVNIRAGTGLPNETEWRHVGFLPVSFRYADLTNADFRWSDLTGADFTGATLTGADFTGAILDGSIFDDGVAGKE